MNVKLGTAPSALPEITELSLTVVMLAIMALFIGGFALHEVHSVWTQVAPVLAA